MITEGKDGEEGGVYVRKTVKKIGGVLRVVKVEVIKPTKTPKSTRGSRYSS